MAPFGMHIKIGLGFGVVGAVRTIENQSSWKAKAY
jgi:hypothetical protein